MRILFVTSSSINGGAQKHIREMFRNFYNLGYDMYLIAPKGWLLDELREYGDKIIPMDVDMRNISQLEKVLDKVKPNITNTFILSGGVFGVAAWKKRKYGKIFITVNNPVIYDGISTVGKIIYPYLYRWMSRYASAFLVKADRVRDEVAKVINNKKPVISIKNGIDFSVFDKEKRYPNIREKLGITDNDVVISNIAALDVRKGQTYLIEAVFELRANYPVHVLFVGEGTEKERLQRIAKEKDVERYVHFLGQRSDINCVLANTDIFVLPSLHEGLPNALMEAMAMGLPCIATDVGGVKQLIHSGKNGLVIKPRSVKEIEEAVKVVINDKKAMKEYGNEAYRTIFEEYKQDVVIKELLSIYENIS